MSKKNVYIVYYIQFCLQLIGTWGTSPEPQIIDITTLSCVVLIRVSINKIVLNSRKKQPYVNNNITIVQNIF